MAPKKRLKTNVKPASKKKGTSKTATKKAKAKTPSKKSSVPKKTGKPATKTAVAKKLARPATKTQKPALKRVKPGAGAKAKPVQKTASRKAPEASAASKAKKPLSPRERRIEALKENLSKQKMTLLTEAEEALNSLPGQTIFPDMGDQASAEIDRTFMLRLRGREQRLLKKIEAAIDKIDSGNFGICEVCGEEIDIKRLEARPVTTMCIICKTEQEEEEKLKGQ